MLATPFLSAASHALGRRVSGAAPPVRADAEPPRDHVVIVGFGHMGETVARLLSRAGVPFRVVDLDPDRVRRGRKRGVAIEYGDASNEAVLRRAGIEWAAAAVVVLSDLRSTRQVVRTAGLSIRAVRARAHPLPRRHPRAGVRRRGRGRGRGVRELARDRRPDAVAPGDAAAVGRGGDAEIRSSRQQGFRKFREPGA
jgi:voltage-gated potassium channel Kch